MNFIHLSEEPLKSKIKDTYFTKFSYSGSKIDFTITYKHKNLGEINLLWTEAKKRRKRYKKILHTAYTHHRKI
ncbi:hypothetical protein [Campylobacter molothri]|uniref:hypothetical protein n=1 Tax=Campylobacter molothri TaxID=1032242 RepID=UPI0039F1D329